MDKVFLNKKHEQLVIYAANYYSTSFITFIDIIKGKILSSISFKYYVYDNEHYLRVTHPVKNKLFVLSVSGAIFYYDTIEIDFKQKLKLKK